ncbi:Uncharacterized iron-regulated membrane protein [Paracoccus isoporae]|uniref:Uncharacterized iron-regulated membrane protein n=1 Tax=Paracoccus isoporae TaxID=591205 RepID=A0A1G7CGQ0_9RHOB|nr:PepSY-associated TM helix domain-containing protein [Paracoccus isoporae]SDE37900.1 Uncharacterized iron-regulated membrane protein [Paracoccus isoporae]
MDISSHASAPTRRVATSWRAFLVRLHFYAGLLIGPFVFIAALTGFLYVITPQIEERLYADILTTSSEGPPQSLAAQASAAQVYLDADLDISAVRPATAPGKTTRIMFADAALNPSENRTVFVDPVTLDITGDLVTYGTSGVLPLRRTIDYLHRNLLLGDAGRIYSELAASWMGVIVLVGLALWLTGPRRRKPLAQMPPPQRRRWVHATLGAALSVILLFISITGLTWSQAAGTRINSMRQALGWTTPSVTLALDHGPDGAPPEQAGHAGHGAPSAAEREDRTAELDAVAATARQAGLDSALLEIRLPKPGQAWMVREYDRSWPTQVDTITLDPNGFGVTSRADFAEFGLIPKLVRWGIDAHMGILFGVANQFVMACVAMLLMTLIVYGYLMWWQRRPVAAPPLLMSSWTAMRRGSRICWAVVALAAGWAMPVMGLSLLLFLAIDSVRWLRRKPIA